MPRPAEKPVVGEIVHCYERGRRQVVGPMAAIVVQVADDQWEYNDVGDVSLAVLAEDALRFVPLVPYADQGVEAGIWWERPGARASDGRA